MKCKPYRKITVEIGTQLKTVKITSNIFAVYTSESLCTKSIIILHFIGLLVITKILLLCMYNKNIV